MSAAHPEAPRTVWAHAADDAPLPVASPTAAATRSHPTLTSLRMRLGPSLDSSGLQAEYVSLRNGSLPGEDRHAATRLFERLQRVLRSDRDIVVTVAPDGDVSVHGADTTWPIRRAGDEWTWLRLFNESDQPRTVVVSAGEQVRTFRLAAAGSRSYLQRLPTEPAGDLVVTASVAGRSATRVVRLETRPTWLLTVRLTDGPARLYLSDELGAIVPRGLIGRRDLHGRWYVQLRRRLVVPVVGDAHIEVARGPEFEPFRAKLAAGDASADKLTVRLHRRIDPASSGWLSADLHAHLHYGGEYLLDAAAAALAQQAEGLWFLNLVVANQESDVVHDRSFFAPEPIVGADSVTSWGEEFRNDFYGHVCLTRPRQLVEPVYSGFAGTEQPFDYPTTVNAAQQSRQVGALVSSAHPLITSRSISDVFDAPRSVEAKELPVLAALGLVDAVDIMSYPGDALLTAGLWYRLLNCGFRLAATAGGDAFMNVADGEAFMHGEPGVIPGSGGRFSSPVGGVRVYAKAERRDRDGLCEAIEAGRTFVTNGPFIGLEVDGMEPGSVIEGQPGARVAIEATVSSWVPIDALELAVNGRVRRRRQLGPPPLEAQVSWTLPIDGPSWIAVRAVGGPDRNVMDDYAFAHSSPVYIDVDGSPVRDPAALRYFQRWIDRLLVALASDCRFAEDWQEREVRGFYERARQLYAPTRAPT